MCGIVALFSRRDPISEAIMERATRSLYHRGPDGQRHWISPNRRVGLGHARLSIIDLMTGDQPIASEDEKTRIVVNGEFYGYESIQRELERSGHRLRTRSDSEIALHLYEELGAQCLHRLRGEFAFVLWDATNRAIFAGCDRFGIKPLFYAFHEENALFGIGSEGSICRRSADARGSHGNGTFGRGTSSLSRSPSRGIDPLPTSDSEDPRNDGDLRESVRDVITDTVYRRQKHPF